MDLSKLSRSECHQAARFLQHYLDGELDIVRAASVAEHLETCRRCGLEARTYESIKIAISAASTATPPSDDPAVERLRTFAEELSEQREH
ncbi:MAG: anti-sigma factor family protein [Georgenia sp.]